MNNSIDIFSPQTSICINDDEVGSFGWAKHLDRGGSTCVAGMNPDEGCQHSFTLRYMLEFLRIPEAYPSAVLHGVSIHEEHQCCGYGSMALKIFENQALDEDCKFALCAIGFDDEEEMRKNVSFYRANNYKTFHHDADGAAFDSLPETGSYWSLAFKELNFSKHIIDSRELSFIITDT